MPVLSTFAMSDFDYIVAVEADTLDRLEGVMRAQRYTKERSFVREDGLFFTGPREPRAVGDTSTMITRRHHGFYC